MIFHLQASSSYASKGLCPRWPGISPPWVISNRTSAFSFVHLPLTLPHQITYPSWHLIFEEWIEPPGSCPR